jgi:UDP-N-acetylglucosamine--N-acetylmuramyl-(pentapeptide) pyrophosphoryl-undecaprenol N-acetylglucosamine transferase
MHVLVVGGGTAGHVVPALPVIARFLAAGDEVTFVGTKSGLEESLIEGSGATFVGIAAGKLRRYLSFENLTDLFRIAAGIWQAWRILGRVRPNVVFSKGGFVAFPVAVAAWLRGVPVVAHESDLTAGLANRLCEPFVVTMCTSFSETTFARFKGRVVHTGSPLRPELLEGDGSAGRAALDFADDKPILLVTGGSLGAEALNRSVRDALADLTADYNVVHVCGAGKLSDDAAPGYRQFEFVGDGWGDIISAADVVVSRAGANALFELLALKKTCLLIPLPAKASRGDQIDNARHMADRGLVHVLPEQSLAPGALARALGALRQDEAAIQARLAEFDLPDAVALLCQEIRAASRAP